MMGADLFMRHRRISARQVRQRLKAMARADAPAFLPTEEERAAYQITAVQPAENRKRRPRRIAAIAAACALLLTGTALLPLLLHRLPVPADSSADSGSSAVSSYAPPVFKGEPLQTTTVQQARADGAYPAENSAIQIKRIRSLEEFQTHLERYTADLGDEISDPAIPDGLQRLNGILSWQLQHSYLTEDLIWIRAEVEGGRCLYETANVARTQDGLTITLRKMAPPEETSRETAAWEFFLMIPRTELQAEEDIRVEFVEDVPRPQIPLTAEKKRELEKSQNRFSSGVYDGIASYYGTYGGSVAVMFGGWADTAIATQTVAGQYFWYPTLTTISVYHEGAWADLPEAYEKGWLTAEDVRDINVYYKTDWLELPREKIAIIDYTGGPDPQSGSCFPEHVNSARFLSAEEFQRFWQYSAPDMDDWAARCGVDLAEYENDALYEDRVLVWAAVRNVTAGQAFRPIEAALIGGTLEITVESPEVPQTEGNNCWQLFLWLPRDKLSAAEPAIKIRTAS